MSVFLKDIVGREISDGKHFLGQVSKILLDNSNGKIIGIENNKGVFFARENILLQDGKLQINNSENVPKNGQNWLGKTVFNQDKQKLGKVYDIFFDENFCYVVQICSIRKIFFFSLGKRVFDYQSILEVSSNGLVVQDSNLIREPLPSLI